MLYFEQFYCFLSAVNNFSSLPTELVVLSESQTSIMASQMSQAGTIRHVSTRRRHVRNPCGTAMVIKAHSIGLLLALQRHQSSSPCSTEYESAPKTIAVCTCLST